MMAPAWCGKYVGKPFAEKGRGPDFYDCWGLARSVLAEQFGVEDLPDYADRYTCTTDKESVSKAFRASIAESWVKVDKPTAGVIVVLRLAGRPWHCAIAVNEQWMLHAVIGTNACLERMDSMVWSDRIEGYYRYVETA